MSFSIKLKLYSEETNSLGLNSLIRTPTGLNNISSKNLLLEQKEILTPLILGEENSTIPFSKLGDNSKMVEEYEGIISKKPIYDDFSIRLNGTNNIQFICLKFNEKYYNETTNIILFLEYGSGISPKYYNKIDFSSNVWLINLERKNEESIYLTFSSTNDFFIIDYISLDYSIEISNKYIKNLTLGERISSDNTKPEFGVIGQYGDCQIIDKNSRIVNLSKDGALNYDYAISILHNNETVNIFSKPKWSYEEEQKSFNVTLEDDLSYMKSVIIPKLSYAKNKNFLDLITTLLSYSNYKYNMSSEIIDYLFNITIKDFYMTESSNLYLELIKVCNLGQICCIIKNVNELEFFRYV